MSRALVFAPLLMLAACMTDDLVSESTEGAVNPDLAPSGRGGGTVHSWAGGTSGGSPIKYHGGPVIEGTVNVYYIWYGNWSGNSATTILEDMAKSIGGTPYYNINKGYYDVSGSTKTFVSGGVNFVKSVNDAGSQGTSLSDAQVFAIVDNAVTTGALPEDQNAVYFVLGAPEVKETSGFCTQYCGWHDHGLRAANNAKLRYAFVGDADTQCPSSCEEQTASSPNGNPGADGMASVITHELEEANTDPDGNAWYDGRGYEDADKCAWTFGTMSTAANGSKYNVTWGSRQFLVQQEWKVSGGCALK